MIVIGAATPQQEIALQSFGEFIGADSIQYIDHEAEGRNGEEYIICKNGKFKTIRVQWNRVDGPFANFGD